MQPQPTLEYYAKVHTVFFLPDHKYQNPSTKLTTSRYSWTLLPHPNILAPATTMTQPIIITSLHPRHPQQTVISMTAEMYLISTYAHHLAGGLAHNRQSVNACFTFKCSFQWFHIARFSFETNKDLTPIRMAKKEKEKEKRKPLTIPNAHLDTEQPEIS